MQLACETKKGFDERRFTANPTRLILLLLLVPLLVFVARDVHLRPTRALVLSGDSGERHIGVRVHAVPGDVSAGVLYNKQN